MGIYWRVSWILLALSLVWSLRSLFNCWDRSKCPDGCALPQIRPSTWNSAKFRCRNCGRRYRLTDALRREWVEYDR